MSICAPILSAFYAYYIVLVQQRVAIILLQCYKKAPKSISRKLRKLIFLIFLELFWSVAFKQFFKIKLP